MRAVVAPEPGGPEALRLIDRPVPEPGPGEVLVRVAATAVNRADLLQCRGHYPPPPGASDVLGLECAGTVAATGAGVTGWAAGDRVMAVLAGGGYAEYATVPADHLLPVPDGWTWMQAAATPEVFTTAFLALVELAATRPGETVIVHAAASGVGIAAVQIARSLGARVIGTSRDRRRLDAAGLSPGEALPVDEGRFADAVRRRTGGNGADVVLDLVGAAYWDENVAALARGGRIVLTGLVGGRRVQADLGILLSRNLTVIGSTLRGRSPGEKAAIAARVREWVMPRLADGTLRPVVHRVVPLAAVADAHRELATNTVVGKLVLDVAGTG